MPAPSSSSAPCSAVLAFDTATARASVAVCSHERVLAEESRDVISHSEGLLGLVDATLRRSGVGVGELAAIVCGCGPGSFTGLRIALATAKGLCLAAGKPLICCSSLLPLALAVEESRCAPRALTVALLDARRDEVYGGLYRGHTLLTAEVVRPPAALLDWLPPAEPLVLVGDGALKYRALLCELLGARATFAPEPCHGLEARYLAQAAWPRLEAGEFDDVGASVPRYIRPSDARLPAGAARSSTSGGEG